MSVEDILVFSRQMYTLNKAGCADPAGVFRAAGIGRQAGDGRVAAKTSVPASTRGVNCRRPGSAMSDVFGGRFMSP
jgi:hypothetical protein